MKNTKRILALLFAMVFVVGMSACEITRENNEEQQTTVDRSYEYVDDEEMEGDDISDKIYGDDSDYELWYADNGDVYAFNGANQFYLKSGDDVYYGSYKFTTSTSTIYSGLLSVMCDNNRSIDETFNVKEDGDGFILTRASNPDDIVRISKEAISQAGTASESDVVETAADESEVIDSDAAVEGESQEDAVSNMDVYEIMGLDIYYLTMIELTEGDISTVTVNASPAIHVTGEDGSVKYEYDSENLMQLTISENTYIYMPDIASPSSTTYACDIYQMRECFDAFGGFYAVVIIGEGDSIESVRYNYVAE